MNHPDNRNVFAIYVSYYVKVKVVLSVMGGEVSLKLPFTLMHTCDDLEHTTETLTRAAKQVPPPTADVQFESKAQPSPQKPEKDGMWEIEEKVCWDIQNWLDENLHLNIC